MHAGAVVVSLIGAALVLAWRVRETTRPVSTRSIVIPPLGMSTGLLMFAYEPARIPLSWALLAFATGALLLAYPLQRSSRLLRSGDVILLKRSGGFLWILLGLVAIRLAARNYVGQYLNPIKTGSLFFLLAFGMIVRWRSSMFLEYRRLTALAAAPPVAELERPDVGDA
jgi:membrane protein CcdC involved in cytochrome C biogenesis